MTHPRGLPVSQRCGDGTRSRQCHLWSSTTTIARRVFRQRDRGGYVTSHPATMSPSPPGLQSLHARCPFGWVQLDRFTSHRGGIRVELTADRTACWFRSADLTCIELHRRFITSPPGGVRSSIVMLDLCLSVFSLAYLGNHTAELHQILLSVARGRGSVLLLRRCDMHFRFRG